jgi:hypothetical protein
MAGVDIGLTIFNAIAGMIISTAISAIMKVAAGDPNIKDDKGNGIQANTRSSKQPLGLLYGQSRLGCNIVFMSTSGENNEYLHIVGNLCEGEIQGFSDKVNGVDPLYLNDKIYTEFGAENVHYELFTGSATQGVCTTLQNDCPEWDEPQRYTAYIYVRLKYDPDYFQGGIPNVTVGLKGLKVDDPTPGRSAGYSNNPGLCTNDLLIRSPLRGGFGLSQARVSVTCVESSRVYCESKGWTSNIPLTEDQDIATNVQMMLNNFRGEILRSFGEYRILYRDLNYEAVVDHFDEDEDIVEGSLSVSQPDIFDLPAAIKVWYYGEEGGEDGESTYKEKSWTYKPPGAVINDGTYAEKEIKCHGLSNLDLVQKMAYYLYERSRLNKTIAFTGPDRALRLDPIDLITVTSSKFGWTNKVARITGIVLDNNWNFRLTCDEEADGFYDEVYNPAVLPWYDTNLPTPRRPASIINVSHYEEVYDYRNRSFTRWVIDFDLPEGPWVDHARVYLRIGSGDYTFQTISKGGYKVDPAQEGVQYAVKFVTVNQAGQAQAESGAYVVSKIIIGKSALPSDLSSMTAVPNGDSVSIYADPVADPDIEGYEVRLGDAWEGAIFVSLNKNCSLRLSGVRPGTHRFWMAPKDNSGQYSSSPVSALVTVFVPVGLAVVPTYGAWTWNFASGSFDNTEMITYNSKLTLKCAHTGGRLDGTWQSPVYDMAAVRKVRVWGDFITYFISSATTFGGVAPDPVTWADLGADTKSFLEIFQPTEAGKVEATLYYSSNGSDYNAVDFFQLLCAEVSARYVYVVLKITDPTLDASTYVQEMSMSAYSGPQ